MASTSGVTIYRRAVTTCQLNPKAYAFTFALFPAFIRADSRGLLAQTAAPRWHCNLTLPYRRAKV
ncbi:MAG: hypothetical protein ABIZ09_08150 [Rhodoferax sp.]